MAEASFKHSGDLGDIIFALPTIRALGGGVLYLDPEGGESSPLVKWADRTRTKLTAGTIEQLRPLLLQQEYVREVREWRGEAVDYDLDLFRKHKTFNNLSDSHLAAFGLPSSERDRAWLTVGEPIVLPEAPIVINRTVRYQGNHGFWEHVLPQIREKCVFVGYAKEHEIFEYTFDQKVRYFPTPTIGELARVIAGCGQFMGNQGFAHALAEGMKKRLVCEVFHPYPAAIFKREGAQYV